MSQYVKEEFRACISAFDTVAKRVLKKDLSQNLEKHQEYIRDLIKTYNDLVDYLTPRVKRLSKVDSDFITDKILAVRTKLARCFGALNCLINVPTHQLLVKIDDNFVTISKPTGALKESDDTESSPLNSDTEAGESSTGIKQRKTCATPLIKSHDVHSVSQVQVNLLNMATAQEKKSHKEYLAKQIPKPYDGDPLLLSSFIAKLESIQEDTVDNLIETTIKWIKGMLIGRAAEAVAPEVVTFAELIAALRLRIHPDSSKVIEGKVAALKVKNGDFNTFAEKAEELSEALRRAYIDEKIPHDMANTMAIERTADMCRAATGSSVVKSAMVHSALFKTPKEAVATFVVQSAKDRQEQHQVLAFRRGNVQNFGNRGRSGANQGRNNNNSGQSYNFRGNSRGNFRGGFRGGYRNQGNRGRFRTRYFQNSGNANVRAVSLNAQPPQQQQQQLIGATTPAIQANQQPQPQIQLPQIQYY